MELKQGLLSYADCHIEFYEKVYKAIKLLYLFIFMDD